MILYRNSSLTQILERTCLYHFKRRLSWSDTETNSDNARKCDKRVEVKKTKRNVRNLRDHAVKSWRETPGRKLKHR